jgi:hypothetical protein
MNKLNTQITLGDIWGDKFYIRDNTGKLTEHLPEWKWEIITNSIAIKPRQWYGRGKALFIVRPI